MIDDIMWLLTWMQAHHPPGSVDKFVTLRTFTNPGWNLLVSLQGTGLETRFFERINDIDRAEHDWICCWVKDQEFDGLGGPFNFAQVVRIFRRWVEERNPSTIVPLDFAVVHLLDHPPGYQPDMNRIEDDFVWLMTWYYSQCNTYWESRHRIILEFTGEGHWQITISIDETALELMQFDPIEIRRSSSDWLQCGLGEANRLATFSGACGLFNLLEVIGVFRRWAQEVYATVTDDCRGD